MKDKMILTAGQKVTIYMDPLTRRQESDEGLLLERIEQAHAIEMYLGYPVEWWKVQFLNNSDAKISVYAIWTKPL